MMALQSRIQNDFLVKHKGSGNEEIWMLLALTLKEKKSIDTKQMGEYIFIHVRSNMAEAIT